MIDIEKMKAAALAATQGEWVVSDHIYASDGKRIASYQMISRDDCENEANATHIATANPAAVLELIEKYKALEAKYERLKPRHEAYVKMLGELLAVLHADGGHYQYEHGTEKAVEDSITKHYELKRQLAEAKLALTPQEPPEGLVPYGHSLEPTRQNADFWYKAGHSEEARHKGESVICMAQAVFAWKNAAYEKAEKEMLLEKQLAELKAENERLNTVPMKYRRMAFNAQLQKENEDFQFRNDRLVQDFADVTEENDALRRIHAENIEIFKRQLAELTEWNNQIGRTNYELRKQLAEYKADAELKGGASAPSALSAVLGAEG